MDLIGETLGKFIIKEEIGRGGMGTVYRARQEGLGRDVALKVLVPEMAERPGFSERFQQEAQAAAGLNHPHILTIYDFGRDGDSKLAYIAMELVTGGTLGDRMTGSGVSRKIILPPLSLDRQIQRLKEPLSACFAYF